MLLLTVLSFLPLCLALDFSCIKYETYITTQYKMAPLDFSDAWFSHSYRFSPKKVTSLRIRPKRILGCCDSGYQYKGFPSYSCQPICITGCPLNAFCSDPNQCTCDVGYYKTADGLSCQSNDALSIRTTTDLIIETTSPKIPCNESCLANEVCSLLDDVCICKNGFHRLNNDGGCIPKCDNSCQNADCTAPNTCTCWPNYEQTNDTSCVPKCDNSCQNADCTAPNTCTCWPHYEQTNDTTCHLKCTELSCTFGTCNANGTCICAEGFFNNGTNCIWAADDIFSEPDDCECWSKFIWQTNMTESRCIQSCEESNSNNSTELTSDCILASDCEFYEGYTICHTQMYKCIDIPSTSAFLSNTITVHPSMTDEMTKNIIISSTKIILLIVGYLALILARLWFRKICQNWSNQLLNYNTMETESTHQEEQI